MPTGPLNHKAFEIAFRYTPFSEVGGDFADFFQLPDGLIGIYLGDVVGKGLPAAMYGALVMGALRGIRKTGVKPAAVLTLLNERLMQRPLPGRFCATLYALFNPSTGELALSNAGLPLPLLVSKTACHPLGEGGLPSGSFFDATYDQHTVALAPGDSVLFATDGLHESRNHQGAEFCAEQLTEAWGQCRNKSAGEAVEFLFDTLHEFARYDGRHDDVTVVVLKISS
ncbi:MAG: PP2C family protein-serine/threonine phosphatase [Candidatus Korobacteraceae bacterium]